jgi:hypothetical protein
MADATAMRAADKLKQSLKTVSVEINASPLDFRSIGDDVGAASIGVKLL